MSKAAVFYVLGENTALEQEPRASVECKVTTSTVSEVGAHSTQGLFRGQGPQSRPLKALGQWDGQPAVLNVTFLRSFCIPDAE